MSREAGFRNLALALRVPGFGWYVGGSVLGNLGVWFNRISMSWLAWDVTHSTGWLGAIAMMDLAVSLVTGPFAGAITDRRNQVHLAILAQIAWAVLAAGLAVLVYAGLATLSVVVVAAMLSGAVSTLMQPVRSSLIAALVPRDLSSTAYATDSMTFHMSRFIGPVAAGTVIAAGGIAASFAVNAVVAVAALVTLWPLLGFRPPQRRVSTSLVADIVEAYAYVWRHPALGPMMITGILSAASGRGVLDLLPGYADHWYESGATGLSWLVGAGGVGATLMSFWLTRGTPMAGIITRIGLWTALGGAILLAFALHGSFTFALACLLILGIAMQASAVLNFTAIQYVVDDDKRGRVIGLMGIIWRGAPALGAFIAGTVAEWAGLSWPAIGLGVVSLAVGLWMLSQRQRLSKGLGV
jgi:MFS family permease